MGLSLKVTSFSEDNNQIIYINSAFRCPEWIELIPPYADWYLGKHELCPDRS